MKLIQSAYFYAKRYPGLSIFVLFVILLMSLFEGVSFGTLIPLIQSMTGGTVQILAKIQFLNRFNLDFSSVDQKALIGFIFLLLWLLILAKNLFLYLSKRFSAKLRDLITRDLRIDLLNNLLEYDMKYMDTVKTGHIITNLNVETQRMGGFVYNVLQFVALSVRIIVYIVLLFIISWKMSIIMFVCMGCVLTVLEIFVRKVRKLGWDISRATANYNYTLMEILGGIRLIKVRSTEDIEKSRFSDQASDLFNYQYTINRTRQLIIPLAEILIFSLIAGCFVIFLNMTTINITQAFPFVATYLIVLIKMLGHLNALNGNRSVAMSQLAAVGTYEKMYDKRGKKTIEDGTRRIDTFSKSIEFKDVNFAYVAGRYVLKNINLVIPKGKIAALVGASGAGKSTLANLIPRFYDINSGRISVDDIDLKDMAISFWRRKIGFVSQDVYVFNMDVKGNISYGHPTVTNERIIEAAKAAKAHDFIMELPDKYDTILGERGVKLSGGQKQRLSIARAIIHNPEILILDEATSSLDTETERLITEAIDKLTKGRTVIAIAHRLSTILHADNIVVIDEGKIVETGNHRDLLVKDGVYRRLYETQFNIKR